MDAKPQPAPTAPCKQRPRTPTNERPFVIGSLEARKVSTGPLHGSIVRRETDPLSDGNYEDDEKRPHTPPPRPSLNPFDA